MKLFPVAAFGIAIALSVAPAPAQQSQPQPPTPGAAQGTGMMDKMMADMKAEDARLESLVQQMRSAQGQEKIRVMQDLLSDLVRNQITMHQRMSMMHDMMSQMPRK